MFKSIKNQFILRDMGIYISLGVYLLLVAVIQTIFAFVDMNGEELYMVGGFLFGFYVAGRIFISFAVFANAYYLSIGFNETRKNMVFSYYIISFIQYAIAVLFLNLMYFISGKIVFARTGIYPQGIDGIVILLMIGVCVVAPIVELFWSGLYERFGQIAYWILFFATMFCFGATSRIVTFLESFTFPAMEIRIALAGIIVVIMSVVDWLLLRKSQIK